MLSPWSTRSRSAAMTWMRTQKLSEMLQFRTSLCRYATNVEPFPQKV